MSEDQSMLNIVCRELFQTKDYSPKGKAIAAIVSMRTPTPEMLTEGSLSLTKVGIDSSRSKIYALSVWEAMIDSALVDL